MTQRILLRASLLFASLFMTANLTAQTSGYTVSGVLKDSLSSHGVEFATVAMTDANNHIVTAIASDANGKFSVSVKQTGEYTLTAEALGYSSYSDKISVDGSSKNIDLGEIRVNGVIEIETAVVRTFKPLISTTVDGMVYSVEADPDSETSTLLEILRKVPQLTVDGEDNVLLNGQSNYKVLVNGKSSTMYDNNFKDVVRSMPANSIQDIEVITNPSTKYEAEGIGGIINIITNRKNRTAGYNANVRVGYGSFDSWNAGMGLTAQLGKFQLSGRYNYGRYGQPETTSESSRVNHGSPASTYVNTFGTNDGHSISNNLSLEASYEIDSLNLITLNLWGYSGSNDRTGYIDSKIEDSNHGLVQSFRSITDNSNTYKSISGSIDYQKMFKKPDRTLTISYKLDNNPRKSSYTNYYEDRYNFLNYDEMGKNNARGVEHTAQIDYYDPITQKHQIEAGIKYILRRNTSDTDKQERDPISGLWETAQNRINDLDYDQHIFGAYGGYLFKLTKFSFKTGFRAEGTVNDGLAKMGNRGETKFDNKLFNVVPYINFSYMIKPNQTARLSYTQRLQRPGIWHLNPYVDDSDPLNIRYGNPDLDAVVSHTFSGNYSFFTPKFNLFANLEARVANNSIQNITTIDPVTGVAENTYSNVGKDRSLNGYMSAGYTFNQKLRLNVGGGVSYVKNEAPSLGLSNEGVTWRINGFLNYSAWKGGSFSAYGGYNSGWIGLEQRGKGSGYSSFGFTQKLLKDQKMDISIRASNPFKKHMTFDYTYETASFYQSSSYRVVQRRFDISMQYRFGKMQNQGVKKARRSINNDDAISAGSEGGVGGAGQ